MSANRGVLDELFKPLRALLDSDNGVTEVCLNRPGEAWTEGNDGWQRHDLSGGPLATFEKVHHLASTVANYNRKALKESAPILSATLPDGERIQIITPPAVEQGIISLTIRQPSFVDFSLEELAEKGAFSEVKNITGDIQDFEKELIRLKDAGNYTEFLKLAVTSKRNIVIVGATGSGKTTFTKSLIKMIPRNERIITIEDVRELFMKDFPNKVHLMYARDDEAGTKVTAKTALASCLRMKPDRILLSELRGDEAWEYVKSVNTGHPGSITTMHANGAFEAFEQMTAFIKDSNTGSHLDSDYVLHRLKTTIDVIMYFDKYKMREVFYDPEFKRDPSKKVVS